MPDAPAENRVPADLAAINLHESREITYWCAHFRCTEAPAAGGYEENTSPTHCKTPFAAAVFPSVTGYEKKFSAASHRTPVTRVAFPSR